MIRRNRMSRRAMRIRRSRRSHIWQLLVFHHTTVTVL